MKTVSARLSSELTRMHEPFGGELCLDFANTIEPRGGPPPIAKPPGVEFRDEITTYDELVAWTYHKDALVLETAEALLEAGDRDPDGSQKVLDFAREFRDVIYRVFWSIAQQQPPAATDLAEIARAHVHAAEYAELVASASEIRWQWSADTSLLVRPLWPIAWSTTGLLTTADHRRIKVCPGPGRPPVDCGWLFHDSSKNVSRRWCSMADCGAAVKAMHQTSRRRNRTSGKESE